jgi:Sec-independent protein translocase protein TatA
MYRRSPRAMLSGISGGILLIGLAIAFFVGPFLPILFITLAFTSLIGSAGSLRPNGLYGGLQGFVWLMGLALCFLIGFWPWILVVCGVSIILGALRAPIVAAIMGMGIFGLASLNNEQPQPQYEQPQVQSPQEMPPQQMPPQQTQQ